MTLSEHEGCLHVAEAELVQAKENYEDACRSILDKALEDSPVCDFQSIEDVDDSLKFWQQAGVLEEDDFNVLYNYIIDSRWHWASAYQYSEY